MTNNSNNYTTQKSHKKHLTTAIILILAALLMFGGVVFAYYSDMFELGGNLSSSTLKIEGTYTVLLNEAIVDINSIRNLVPGDVIVIKGNVQNTGKECAWIREKLHFNVEDPILMQYLRIYNIELNQNNFLQQIGVPDYTIPVTPSGYVLGSNKVIDSTTQTAPRGNGEYEYLGKTTYDFAFTIYFMHEAPNSTQNKQFGITVTTQVLQFQNNNFSEPDEISWATVEAQTQTQ